MNEKQILHTSNLQMLNGDMRFEDTDKAYCPISVHRNVIRRFVVSNIDYSPEEFVDELRREMAIHEEKHGMTQPDDDFYLNGHSHSSDKSFLVKIIESFSKVEDVMEDTTVEIFGVKFHTAQLLYKLYDFFMSMMDAKTSLSYWRAFTNLIQYVTGSRFTKGSLLFGFGAALFLKFASKAFKGISNRFKSDDVDYGQSGEEPIFSKSERNLSDFKMFTGRLEAMEGSHFTSHVLELVSLVLCMPIMAKHKTVAKRFLGSQVFKKAESKMENRSPPYVALRILSCASEISQRFGNFVIHYARTGSWCPNQLYLDDARVLEFDNMYSTLHSYSGKLTLLSNIDYSLDQYIKQCVTAAEMAKRMIPEFRFDKYTQNMLKKKIISLDKWASDARDIEASLKDRETPLCLALISPPGVGKTNILKKMLDQAFRNEMSIRENDTPFKVRPFTNETICVHNEADEYFSNYTPDKEVFWVDDIGQYKNDITTAKQGSPIDLLIKLINGVPYTTNQAGLEEKGKIAFRSRYIAITSNVPDIGISQVFVPGSGAPRRINFISCSVKEEYREVGTTNLDPNFSDYTNHDCHHFGVYRMVPLGDTYNKEYWNPETESYSTCTNNTWNKMDFKALLRWLYLRQKQHYSRDTNADKSLKHFMSAANCVKCNVSFAVCGCDVPQGATGQDKFFSFFGNIKTNYPKDVMFDLSLPARLAKPLLKLRKAKKRQDHDAEVTARHVIRKEIFRGPRSKFGLNIYYKFYTKHFSEDIEKTISDAVSLSNKAKLIAFGFTGLGFIRFIINSLKRSIVFGSSLMAQGGPTEEKALIPEPNREPWQQFDWNYNPINKSRVTGKKNNITVDQLVDLCKRNTVRLEFVLVSGTTTRTKYTNAFGLRGCQVIFPMHNLLEIKNYSSWRVNVIREKSATISLNRMGLTIAKHQFQFFPETDTCLFTHPEMSLFRDLTPYLMKANELGQGDNGKIVKRSVDGSITVDECYNAMVETLYYNTRSQELSNRRFWIPDKGLQSYRYRGIRVVPEIPTGSGDCGAPYIFGASNGAFIAGIHVCGRTPKFKGDRSSGILPVTQESLSRFIYEGPNSYNGTDLSYFYETDKKEQLEIHEKVHVKCPTRWVQEGSTGAVMGSLKVPRRKLKTAFKRPPFAEDALKHFDLQEFTHHAPMVDRRNAMYLSLHPRLNRPKFSSDLLHNAKRSVYNQFRSIMSELDLQLPDEPYSLEIGINGLPGSRLSRLPLSTSGGFTKAGPKRRYFRALEPTKEYPLNMEYGDQLQKEHDRIVQAFYAGEYVPTVFGNVEKDEPISTSKLEKNKCRIFNTASVPLNVLGRMYYGCFINLFYGKHRTNFGMAMGANCLSKDWDDIYNWVTEYGKDRCFAGDFKNFDFTITAEVMEAVFWILNNLLRDQWKNHPDWPKWKRMLDGIMTCLMYPTVDVAGTVLMLTGNNTSGNFLTTLINCISNIIYHVMSLTYVGRKRGLDVGPGARDVNTNKFWDYFHLVTLGDDSIGGSKLDWFNHTAIEQALAQFGVTYTMADKESKSVKFSNIADLDFLSRGFKTTYPIDKIRCPLKEESIVKMLTCTMASKDISPENQYGQQICNAANEWFQYGRKRYNQEKLFLDEIIRKYKLEPYIHNDSPKIPKDMRCRLWTYKEMRNVIVNKDAMETFVQAPDLAQSSEIEFYDSDQHFILDSDSEDSDNVTLVSYEGDYTDITQLPLVQGGRKSAPPRLSMTRLACGCSYDEYDIWRRADCYSCHCDTMIHGLCAICSLDDLNDDKPVDEAQGGFRVRNDYKSKSLILNNNHSMDNNKNTHVPGLFDIVAAQGLHYIQRNGLMSIKEVNKALLKLGAGLKQKHNRKNPCSSPNKPTVFLINQPVTEAFIEMYADIGDDRFQYDVFREVCIKLDGELTIGKMIDLFIDHYEDVFGIPFKTSAAEHKAPDVAQSGTMENVVQSGDQQQEENVGFADAADEYLLKIGTEQIDQTLNAGRQEGAELAQFMSRPIVIDTEVWSLATAFHKTFYPWQLYLNNPVIKRKIDNFKLIRGTLKLKFVLNGTQFHYGRVLVGVRPMNKDHNNLDLLPTTAIAATNYHSGDTSLARNCRPGAVFYSQKPHIFLDPSTNQPGTITWPFFAATNWLDLTLNDPFARMGQIEMWELSDLRMANGGTDSVTIQCFAWMEDFEVSGLTQTEADIAQSGTVVTKTDPNDGMAMGQSGDDEYKEDGAISAPATAVAAAASRLTGVPMIGRFATATKIGAGAVADIARLFGFSKPTIVTDTIYVRPQPLGQMATASDGDPVAKLTFDKKQELTLDPGIVGLKPDDELSFMSIARKETYIDTFTWSKSDSNTNDGCIYSLIVHPCVAPIFVHETSTVYAQTALSFVTTPFRHWTGALKYRFQFVASQYHKGRVGFAYDPTALNSNPNTTVPYPDNFFHVLDLGQQRDITFEINWSQQEDYRGTNVRTGADSILAVARKPARVNISNTYTPFNINGVIRVFVINSLTAPTDDQPITCNVFISAGSDFQVRNPIGVAPWSYTTASSTLGPPDWAQSGTEITVQESAPNQVTDVVMNGVSKEYDGNRDLVYFGDPIHSFRTLLKRYCAYRILWENDSTADAMRLHRWDLCVFPVGPGRLYGATGTGLTSINAPITDQYNAVNMTYMHYVARAYAGWRGSVRYKINKNEPYYELGHLAANRHINHTEVIVEAKYENTIRAGGINLGSSNVAWLQGSMMNLSDQGIVMTNPATNGALEFELPFMSNLKYAELMDEGNSNGYGVQFAQTWMLSDTFNNTTNTHTGNHGFLEMFTAAGEDFTCFFFVGAPFLYMTDIGTVTWI